MSVIVLFPDERVEGKAYMDKKGLTYRMIDPTIEGWCEQIETGEQVYIHPHENLWNVLREDGIDEEDIFIIPTEKLLLEVISQNPRKILQDTFQKGNNYLLKRIFDCNTEHSLYLTYLFLQYSLEYRNTMILSCLLKSGVKSKTHYLPLKEQAILGEKYPDGKIIFTDKPREVDTSSPLAILHSAIFLQDSELLKRLSEQDIKDLSGDDSDMNYSPLIVPFGVTFREDFLVNLLKLFPYEMTYETTRLYRAAIASSELNRFYYLLPKGSLDHEDLLDLNPKFYDAFSYLLQMVPELYVDRILEQDLAWAYLLLPKGNYRIPETSKKILLVG